MYTKCGMIDEVSLVFDQVKERDKTSWNLLLSAYLRMGWPKVVVHVLVWMHWSGVKLDSFALGGILKACSELEGSEDVRRMLHACVVKVGLDLDMFVGSAMVDMYAKNGGLEEATKVFDCIPNQNAVVYGAMIAVFARLGNDPCPEDDEFIANALINLYSKARSVSDSLRCFHMTPRQYVVTWTSIITAFAHDENFEKALGQFLDFFLLEKSQTSSLYRV
uniref:Pentatricopeptide repeat-containing protein n=1 Tax=Hordeum vulgare subsp. vulgare TaxID=112509 RepID=A0A8I6WFH0_HORVV